MNKENLTSLLSLAKKGNPYGEEIVLVGATKTVSTDVINQAIDLGLQVVAENKVQEFREKTDLIDKRASQHFIGHLQTNKVKYLIGKVDLIHSVDSVHLADAISKESLKKGVSTDILIEINVGGELSKSGFDFENVFDAVHEVSLLPNIRIRGLMAMLPKTDDKDLLKTLCTKMRTAFEKLKNDNPLITYLSMGMSADYNIAIECGSNMIRLGSRIFGERNY